MQGVSGKASRVAVVAFGAVGNVVLPVEGWKRSGGFVGGFKAASCRSGEEQE